MRGREKRESEKRGEGGGGGGRVWKEEAVIHWYLAVFHFWPRDPQVPEPKGVVYVERERFSLSLSLSLSPARALSTLPLRRE